MSPGGDGIYCRMFLVRERREVLSSHSPWPGREPGTCLELVCRFPKQERGWAGKAQTLPRTRDAWAIRPISARVAFDRLPHDSF